VKIKDIMTPGVECVSPDDTLQDAAAKMKSLDVGPLPVCERNRVVGILTDRDITVRAVSQGKDPNSCTVRDAMSEHIIYCFDDQDTQEAASLMGQKQIRRLAVLNHDKRLVGVVSLGDIAHRAHDESSAERALEGVSKRPS